MINITNLLDAIKTTNWIEVLIALLVGAVFGWICAKFKLPAPAPLVLAGIAGIVGIWLGYILGK